MSSSIGKMTFPTEWKNKKYSKAPDEKFMEISPSKNPEPTDFFSPGDSSEPNSELNSDFNGSASPPKPNDHWKKSGGRDICIII